MLKIAIVDDDEAYINTLKTYISRYQDENIIEIEVCAFLSGLKLIVDYEPIYDILFLDIEMPHMDGFEVAKSVRKLDSYAVIVFITNMAQHAIKGYEVNANDYIIKPIDYFMFSVKLKAAINSIDTSKEQSLLISWEGENRYINLDEIIFIEVRDHYLYINTKDMEYRMLGILKEKGDQLKDFNFIQCNKSFIVNIRHITRMSKEFMILQDNHKIKVSRARRKEVQKAFMKYYSKEM